MFSQDGAMIPAAPVRFLPIVISIRYKLPGVHLLGFACSSVAGEARRTGLALFLARWFVASEVWERVRQFDGMKRDNALDTKWPSTANVVQADARSVSLSLDP